MTKAEHFEGDEPNSIAWESIIVEQGCPSSIPSLSRPFPLSFFLCFCCFLFLAIFPYAASFIMSVVLRHVSP